MALGGGDGGVTEAETSVGSDGFGAGVPTGVGEGSLAVTVAGADAVAGLAVAVGVAVGTVVALRRPAPERARGTVPSRRKRIAMIPRPQRA